MGKVKKMKSILITGGPTNEYIDEVMKITNMSTGSLSVALSKFFLSAGYKVTAVFNHSVDTEKIEIMMKEESIPADRFEVIGVETTEEMMKSIKQCSSKANEDGWKYDAVIHAAAVGDYKGEFSFLLEDLAEELFAAKEAAKSPQDFLSIMENPLCKLRDDTKISSYQKNLTVKLGLTPKIIASLRGWFPRALLVGCKLLEDVPKEELYKVATKLAAKNSMDYILANDLADLRHGQMTRHLCTKEGFTGIELGSPEDIFKFVDKELSEKTND